jgi:hypothetical protein
MHVLGRKDIYVDMGTVVQKQRLQSRGACGSRVFKKAEAAEAEAAEQRGHLCTNFQIKKSLH